MLSFISNIKSSTRLQGYDKFIYYFSDMSYVFLHSIYLFSSFNDRKVKIKYYNKQIMTHDNHNVQSHIQLSKLNSTINAKSGAHGLTHDKITKSPFNKNNIATTKSK